MVKLVILRWRLLMAVLCVSPVSHGVAQDFLSDPTRPALASGDAQLGVQGDSAQPGNELQSILLVPGRKPRALISGQWLEQGQLYGDSRVVKINPANVILQPVASTDMAQQQVLTLTPGIQKTAPVKEKTKRVVEIK